MSKMSKTDLTAASRIPPSLLISRPRQAAQAAQTVMSDAATAKLSDAPPPPLFSLLNCRQVESCDVKSLMENAAAVLLEASGAEIGMVVYEVRAANGERYSLYAGSGLPIESVRGFGIDTRALRFSGRSGIMRDDVPVVAAGTPLGWGWSQDDGRPLIRSYAAAALERRPRRFFGGVFIGHSSPAMFSQRTLVIVYRLCFEFAVAVERATALEKA